MAYEPYPGDQGEGLDETAYRAWIAAHGLPPPPVPTTEGTPDTLWDPNLNDWTRLVSAAPAGSNFQDPSDWRQYALATPGFYGTYIDPRTGEMKNTPPPPNQVGGGYSQAYNPQTGRWEMTGTPVGGFFGWVEQNPYLFAALAATSLIGGPVLAGGGAAASGGAAGAEAGAGAAAGAEAGAGAVTAGTTAGELAVPAGTGSSGLFGTGITAQEAFQGASLLNSAQNAVRNPSGSSVGGLVGGAVGAYTGVPGLGAAGSFAGGEAQNTLEGGSAHDRLGGANVATDSSDTSSDPNYAALIAQLGASGIGLAGSGLTLAQMPAVLKNLEKLYQQNQGNYLQQTQYAQLYQALLQHYQQQQQQQFQTETAQTAEDRAARQQAYQAQTGERALDRSNIATANQGRAGIAGRLSDPRQVAAGAQSIYQPMSQAMTDNLLRGVQRDLAMRGQSDGGAASRATADAMAPFYNQLQQQAMQNFLSSQGQALSAYNPLTGPYTTDAPQGPYAPKAPQPPYPAQLPRVPDYIPGSNTGPQANQAGGYGQLSNQIAQLGKLLSTPGGAALVSKIFGGGGGDSSGNPSLATSTDAAGQQYNTDFMNSFGSGGGGTDYSSSLDSSYFDNTADTSYNF